MKAGGYFFNSDFSDDQSVAPTQTTTYTVPNGMRVVPADSSGASFGITLPAAAANIGVLYNFIKTDASLNAITLTRAGSDTITGDNASSTSTNLSTQGEMLSIMATSSTAWYITKRQYPTGWTAFTPSILGISGFGTNTGQWKRAGDSIHVRQTLVKNGNAGSGTGLVQFNLPLSGVILDTTKLENNLGAMGNYNIFAAVQFDRPCMINASSGTTTTGLFIQAPGTTRNMQAGDVLAAAEMYLNYVCPLATWK